MWSKSCSLLKPPGTYCSVFSPLLPWFAWCFQSIPGCQLLWRFRWSVVHSPWQCLPPCRFQVSRIGFDLFLLYLPGSANCVPLPGINCWAEWENHWRSPAGYFTFDLCNALAGITCSTHTVAVQSYCWCCLYVPVRISYDGDAARLHVCWTWDKRLSLFFEAENHSLIYDFGSGGSEIRQW